MIEFDLQPDQLLHYSDPYVQNAVLTQIAGMSRVFALLALLLILWQLYRKIKRSPARRKKKARITPIGDKASPPAVPEKAAPVLSPEPPKPTADFYIRPVKNRDDARLVSELAREIWTDYFNKFLDPPQVAYMLRKFQSWISIQDQMASGVTYRLIFLGGGAPAGYYAWETAENTLILRELYLWEGARSRGIGSALLRELADLARQQGLGKMTFAVSRENSAAIGFFEKQGFSVESRSDLPIGGGFTLRDYTMTMPLSR